MRRRAGICSAVLLIALGIARQPVAAFLLALLVLPMTSVGRWQRMLASGGRRSVRGAPRTGRPPLLDANDQKRLMAALKAGALAQGYSSDLWTLGRVGKLKIGRASCRERGEGSVVGG